MAQPRNYLTRTGSQYPCHVQGIQQQPVPKSYLHGIPPIGLGSAGLRRRIAISITLAFRLQIEKSLELISQYLPVREVRHMTQLLFRHASRRVGSREFLCKYDKLRPLASNECRARGRLGLLHRRAANNEPGTAIEGPFGCSLPRSRIGVSENEALQPTL